MRQTFDALGRATKTIQHYVDGTPSASNPDEDVTVEMAYHPSGQLETKYSMTAKGHQS
jgi:hypothetical protein